MPAKSISVTPADCGPADLLSNNNTKTDCWTFFLLALRSCPGASGLCRRICYGLDNVFRMEQARNKHLDNLKATKRADFVDRIVAELSRRDIDLLRVHGSGDFYSALYIRKWYSIAALCPGTLFWTYTRSWVIRELRPALLELAALPNFTVWASWDRTMPIPDIDLPTCYLMEDDYDQPPIHADLAFRHRAHQGSSDYARRGQDRSIMTVAAYSTPVCPHEDGITQTTCRKCGICFGRGR